MAINMGKENGSVSFGKKLLAYTFIPIPFNAAIIKYSKYYKIECFIRNVFQTHSADSFS